MRLRTRSGAVFGFLVSYVMFLAGCGGSSSGPVIIPTQTPTSVPTATTTSTPTPSSTPTPTPKPTQSPTPTPSATPTFPPPFDATKGEGNLLSGALVVTYPAAASPSTSDVSAPELALNSYYLGLICPSNLSMADCTTNKANLNTPQFGNFDVDDDPIGKNPLGITKVDAVKITYTAINVDQSALTVSGGIVIPQLAPASIKGLILYFHGTTVQRTNVPSNFLTTDNASTANPEGILLAAIWASQGYVVVMPDYIGLGVDTTHPHPYVIYPQQNAQSGLAMVKAVRPYLASNYGITGPLALDITGYSEGGAYSLEAAHLMQNNPGYASVLNVALTDEVPVDGAFDLTGTTLPYLFFNISSTNNPWFSLNTLVSAASKPYLSVDLALGFAKYSGIAPSAILADKFYQCSDPACGSAKNLDGLYYGTNSDATVLTTVLTQAFNTSWSLTNNAITPLLTDTYATALMDGDLTNPLYKQVASSDTYVFIPGFPVTIASLMQDSVVTRKNSDVAFDYFIKNNPTGPYMEELVKNANFMVYDSLTESPEEVDHLTAQPFMSVLVLNQFNMAK